MCDARSSREKCDETIFTKKLALAYVMKVVPIGLGIPPKRYWGAHLKYVSSLSNH